jgi:hypothetical protein
MTKLFKVDRDNEITYIDLSKICYVQLHDEPNGFLNLEVRFPGECYVEFVARQRAESENNEKADALRKVYRDLIFAWETFDAQKHLEVNVSPVDVQTGPPVVPLSFVGTISNT